jgi:hypothetical protein
MNGETTKGHWRQYWLNRDAWTVCEFAQLCCGWNPSEYLIHDQAWYNEARDSINRAVRVKTLSTIDDLAWPATPAECMFESVPAFRPRDAAPWAMRHYAGRFPFSLEDFADVPKQDRVDSRERSSLLTIIAALADLAKVSLEHPSKAAEVIEGRTRALKAPVSKRTIETHLKRIPEALERRGSIE